WEVLLDDERLFRVRPCLGLVSFGFAPTPENSVDIDSVEWQMRLLSGKDAAGHKRAGAKLAWLGKGARAAAPVLGAALSSSEESVRHGAAEALIGIGVAGLPELITGLYSDKTTIVLSCTGIIGMILRTQQGDVKAAAPALRRLLHHA